MDYVTIEKGEMKSEELKSDQGANDAKIKELESIISEMKKKIDKVSEEV